MNFWNLIASLLHFALGAFFIYALFTKGNFPLKLGFFFAALFLLGSGALFLDFFLKNRKKKTKKQN